MSTLRTAKPRKRPTKDKVKIDEEEDKLKVDREETKVCSQGLIGGISTHDTHDSKQENSDSSGIRIPSGFDPDPVIRLRTSSVMKDEPADDHDGG